MIFGGLARQALVETICPIIRYVLLGALLAGIYGILHDQITYTLAPEYFTEFKFYQFADADFDLGNRVFAGTVGFLAAWWVGLVAGWVVGRLLERRIGRVAKIFEIAPYLLRMLGIVFTFGLVGFAYGSWRVSTQALERWASWREVGVSDLEAFARVGYIHNFGYLGAALGLGFVVWQVYQVPRSKPTRKG